MHYIYLYMQIYTSMHTNTANVREMVTHTVIAIINYTNLLKSTMTT